MKKDDLNDFVRCLGDGAAVNFAKNDLNDFVRPVDSLAANHPQSQRVIDRWQACRTVVLRSF